MKRSSWSDVLAAEYVSGNGASPSTFFCFHNSEYGSKVSTTEDKCCLLFSKKYFVSPPCTSTLLPTVCETCQNLADGSYLAEEPVNREKNAISKGCGCFFYVLGSKPEPFGSTGSTASTGAGAGSKCHITNHHTFRIAWDPGILRLREHYVTLREWNNFDIPISGYFPYNVSVIRYWKTALARVVGTFVRL